MEDPTAHLSPQAPVSSAAKASTGKAMPARPWTASTIPSALCAAPVVSAAPASRTLRPPHTHTHCRGGGHIAAVSSSVHRAAGPSVCPLSAHKALPSLLWSTCFPNPQPTTFLSSVPPFLLPPFLPSLDSSPAGRYPPPPPDSPWWGLVLGSLGCLGRQ